MGDLKKEIAPPPLTPDLNAATERATKLVLAVEHFLSEECQLGIPASIRISEGMDEDGRISQESGWNMHAGKADSAWSFPITMRHAMAPRSMVIGHHG